MIRSLKTSALLAGWAAALALAAPASAAVETDPDALYAAMKRAYDQGQSSGWPFSAERYYEATVFDAGRSYALFRPDDPQNAELASLAVGVATLLHYNPLTDENAAEWYVRRAAAYVRDHGQPDDVAQANALLARLDAGDDDPQILGAQAEEDAGATAKAFGDDGDALVQAIVADVRAYNLTKVPRFRSALLARAAVPAVPLMRVPDPEFLEMFATVSDALSGAKGFSQEDIDNARSIDERRRREPELQTIAYVRASSHTLRMTQMAPADEYFGEQKMSPLGVRNELKRLNQYLDLGWGDRMASRALDVTDAVTDWQHQYPHDPTMAQHLLDTYHVLVRVGTPVRSDAQRLRTLILVEYAGTPQALELSSS